MGGRRVGKLQVLVMIHESDGKLGMRSSRCAPAIKVVAVEGGAVPHLD